MIYKIIGTVVFDGLIFGHLFLCFFINELIILAIYFFI